MAFERQMVRRAGARDQPAVGQDQEPPQPRLRAHYGMKRPSKRDRAALVFLGEWRVVVLDRGQFLLSLARTQTARDQQGRHHGGEQDQPQHEAVEQAGRAEHDGRRPHQRVADHAAEPGRQRPRAAMRPAAREPRRDHHAENPAADPQRFAVEAAMGQHAPAPNRHGKDQHDRAEPEDLHQQIGADRAGIAGDVADRARGRVAQARILHRPCHQRRRRHAG